MAKKSKRTFRYYVAPDVTTKRDLQRAVEEGGPFLAPWPAQVTRDLARRLWPRLDQFI